MNRSIDENKKRDDSVVPKITKPLLIIKWIEAFVDYTIRTIEARTIPLTYVIWPVEVIPSIGASQVVTPHSVKHRLVKDKLIA